MLCARVIIKRKRVSFVIRAARHWSYNHKFLPEYEDAGINDIAESIELKEIMMIIPHQRRLDSIEMMPQTWSFTFGSTFPNFRDQIFSIVNITPRNLWMEPLHIFHQIKALRPDKIFHTPESYVLNWQPSGSSFLISIPLTDIVTQERVINQRLQRMSLRSFFHDEAIFYFCHKDPSATLFAASALSSSSNTYRTKYAVLEELCNIYMEKALPICDLRKILAGDYSAWKSALFSYLSPDQKKYHSYLLEAPQQVLTMRKMEEKYQDGEVSFQDYTDFRFQARKGKVDLANLIYPRPYESDDCIICHELKVATVHCPQCSNMVCKSCINHQFFDNDTKIGSFISMHRIFCLKRTPIQKNNIDICKELHYLSDLRYNCRSAPLQHCYHGSSSNQMEDDFGDNILDSPSNKESRRYSEIEEDFFASPEPRQLN